MAASLVHIRVDAKVKAKAQKALASMGLSVSDAVRLLLVRVATEKALPFEIRVPNRASAAAMEDSRAGRVEDVTFDDLRAAFHEKAQADCRFQTRFQTRSEGPAAQVSV